MVTMTSLYKEQGLETELGLSDDERLQKSENFPYALESKQHGLTEAEVGRWLIPSYPSYHDQYLSGAGEMHIHFGWVDNRTIRMSSVSQVPANYCAVFGKPILGQKRDVIGRESLAFDGYSGDRIKDSTTDHEKFTVFVRVFETADGAEYREERSISQVIGLQPYDQCPCIRMRSADGGVEVFTSLGIIDHELSIRVLRPNVLKDDWEAGALSSLLRDRGNNDVIECTSQIMYAVTEHDGDYGVRLLGYPYPVPHIALAIRLSDTDKLVRVAASVLPGLLLDVYHVLLSTFDFEPPGVGHMIPLQHEQQTDGTHQAKNTQGPRDSCSKPPGVL